MSPPPSPPYSVAGEDEDLCSTILSRYSNSPQANHQHICTAIGAISQGLKDQSLPLSPIAYFGATCNSLDRLSEEPEPPAHVVESFLTILSIVMPRVSPKGLVRKKMDYVADLVFRVLRSKSVTPNAVAAALRCVSYMVGIQEKVTWQGLLCSLYGFILTRATDPSEKVRKQAHICLRDAHDSFRRTAVLVPASEAITKILERLLLLGSNPSDTENSKGGAQEVLFLLDALKDSLPLLSPKFANTILKHFKALLEVRQPVVTRRITSCLNSVCQYPTLEVSPEVLLDLLCSLSLSISANEMSADDMAFTARLIDIGMKKVYSVNQKQCAAKLPLVFNALADMLASEHEAALLAATESLKNLINACIDESLIQQGINQIRGSGHEANRKSGPTTVEKICATVENLLDYRYSEVWDMSFQVASALFEKLGMNSPYLMKGTLKNLADMQKLPDEDFPYRKQLHECIGSALATMGPETFLSILPLKLEYEDLSEANDWLFPILKQYTIGARLSFFTESILPMIRNVKRRSLMLEREGKMHSSRSVAGLIYSLWSLLPSFCNYPLDTFESFKDLEKELFRALREEPDVLGIICSALKILIQQNKKIVDGKEDLHDIEVSISIKQAVERYTPEVASNNLSVLRSSAREYFVVLSGLFMQSPKDTGGNLQATIKQFASIADKTVVTRFFTNTMQKLLKATQEVGKAGRSKSTTEMQIDNSSNKSSVSLARAQLLDLAVALLPGLNFGEIDLLYSVIDPAVKDADGLIQKKAYKVLSHILKNSDGFISRKIEDLLNLMTNALHLCHFSAKRHRLDCLYFLIVHIAKGELVQRRRDNVASFLTEIILALKEANKKTRTRAYDMIVEIGHAFGDEERGGKKENLHQFFSMVAGGLAGESPHMISAAVTGLARLAYEFSDLVSAAYNVLPSTFLLLRRKNKEILKASLGLLKVLVAKSPAEGLQIHLKSIVEGLLMWQDGTKNHFKAKVKYLLEMLVKKCGIDAVKSVMPEDHMKLLTNIRKIKERKERRTSVISEDDKSHKSKATTSRLSRWNHTKIFSEFGDEEESSEAEYMDGKATTGRRSKASAMKTSKSTIRRKRSRDALLEDSFDQFEDEPLDLLDRERTRSSLRSSSRHSRHVSDLNDELEVDPEGRLIIREDGERKPKREKSPDLEDDDDDKKSRAESKQSMNSQRGRKRKKISEKSGGWAYTGHEYASKKASGDVKRKGKLEPYAYWSFDRKMMSRRPEHRAAARKGMSSVVNMTKRMEGRSVASALLVGARKKIQKKKSKK